MDRYDIIREMGRGVGGITYLAFDNNMKKNVLLKRIRKENIKEEEFRREIDIMKNLRHTYIPPVHDYFIIKDDVYTVMDYVDGYDLGKLKKNGYQFSEKQLRLWMKQLSEVLEYLHGQKNAVYHCDIKPENIMVTKDGNICLIDFNVSIKKEGGIMGHLLGYTYSYVAPEFYQAFENGFENEQLLCDGRFDIYSIAATCYFLMTGIQPNPKAPVKPLTAFENLQYSTAFCAIVDKAMAFEADRRYENAGKLRKALDNIEKMDPQFKWCTRIQWGISIIYGIATVISVLLVYYGVSENRKTEYREIWNNFYELTQSGESEDIIRSGLYLLNDKNAKKYMTDDERREILYTIGNEYYDEEEYNRASEYFKDAAMGSKEANYYRDYAIALARNNQMNQAEEVLKEAAKYTTQTEELMLIEAEILAAKEQYNDALDKLDTIISGSSSRELLVRSYMLCANIYESVGQWSQQVQCLKGVLSYDNRVDYRRKYGEALCHAADAITDDEETQKYELMAYECYSNLCRERNASLNDKINLGIVGILLGKYEESRTVLWELESAGYQDYRIELWLCESYLLAGVKINQQTQDAVNMRYYYEAALKKYNYETKDQVMENLIELFTK